MKATNSAAPAIAFSSDFKHESNLHRIWRTLISRPSAVIGMVIIAFFIFLAIFGEAIAPYDYTATDVMHRFARPSAEHICGTDSVGRDIFSRLIVGTRYSLLLGVAATFLGVLVGMIIGCIAGYYGGVADEIIMRVLDVVQSIPGMVLNIAMACVLGKGYFETIIVMSINSIAPAARMLRAQIFKIRTLEYIEAAEITNCSKLKIMVKHLVPNALSPMMIMISMGIGTKIMAAAGLAYLGLGVQEPSPEWGALLSAGRQFIEKYPWLCIYPGILIMLIVLAFNLFGDGLRDALDPKLKK